MAQEAITPTGRTLAPLGRAAALNLLASVSLGRIVFTLNALPAIRPVNHAIIDGQLVIRTHHGAALAAAIGTIDTVVAYEADEIDHETHLGWSVIVTGFARLVRDSAELSRYTAEVAPWIEQPLHQALTVTLDEVTGYRVVASATGLSGPQSENAGR